MAKKGDIVRFLNEVGGGRISRIEGHIAYVEDEDGFETPVEVRQIVVVTPAEEVPVAKPEVKVSGPTVEPRHKTAPAPKAPVAPEPEPLDISETPEGDILNVVLGFEPMDIKQLSHTDFEMSMVNDSNYYLLFTVSNIDPDGNARLLHAGTVEPNIQVTLGQYAPSQAGQLERLNVQILAYKAERDFKPVSPVSASIKIDTTKFFKLHCFRPSTYFETPSLAFDVVRDGIPAGSKGAEKSVPKAKKEPEVSALAKLMETKMRADKRPRPKRQISKPKYQPGETIIIDLHINELVDTTAGMSPADMLNLQVDIFRGVMDDNLRNHGQKIVFIHGKGSGVLRQALEKELKHRYKEHDVCDASFAEYGYGATQVTIK